VRSILAAAGHEKARAPVDPLGSAGSLPAQRDALYPVRPCPWRAGSLYFAERPASPGQERARKNRTTAAHP